MFLTKLASCTATRCEIGLRLACTRRFANGRARARANLAPVWEYNASGRAQRANLAREPASVLYIYVCVHLHVYMYIYIRSAAGIWKTEFAARQRDID